MTDASTEESQQGAPTVPASTYQLLRDRLRSVAQQLRAAADQLNADRSAVFAAVPLALAEQDRLNTEQPTTPRDVISVDEMLLFGFNAGASLGRTRHVSDAFALFTVDEPEPDQWAFHPVSLDDDRSFLRDPGFRRDLSELFTYYADTRLTGLRRVNDRLLMVFSVGTSADDVRVLRWQCDLKDPSAPPTYIDAYGDHELTTVDPYDFVWHEAGRDLIVEGRWRHYAIDGTVFVGLDKKRVEFRIDDVVSGGRTVFTEAVAEEQSVDELRLSYAVLGDVILLRLSPYREPTERFYIFNKLTRAVARADAIGRNCHQLPEGQGVVFPGGFHLQNGETKVFTVPTDTGVGETTGFGFHAAHKSPNGEDILYAYYRASMGEYLLCPYNVVARTMATPIITDGYALFDDGVIVSIRHADEPQRVHAISVYTSPFCTVERYAPPVAGESFLGRIGNPELVRVLGEALSLSRDAESPEFNKAVFEALVHRSTALLDSHAWLEAPEAQGVGTLLVSLRKTAGDVLDEFATVVAAKQEAGARLSEGDRLVADLSADAELELRDATTYINRLAAARSTIGRLVELADVREIDLEALGVLRERAEAVYQQLATRAVDFLATPEALEGVFAEFDRLEQGVGDAATAAEVGALAAAVDDLGGRVVLLTEVVGGLPADDPTVKTAVLTRLSDALARRNSVRAALDTRAGTLRSTELAASYQASIAVLTQRSQASLMAAATAAECDAALSTLIAELENAELEFGLVEEYAEAIAAKRDEIVAAFTHRRETLAAERTRSIDRMSQSATRVIETITNRAGALAERAEVDTFFTTDPLVAKVRATAAELTAMGEAGRAGELEVALTNARDQARRAVADRAELFEAGSVKIGRWKFGVNTEPFELRLETDDHGDSSGDQRTFLMRLTGTDLTMPIDNALLGDFVDIADQSYPTETATLPRALYLALDALSSGVAQSDVSAHAARSIAAGYEPGVHDADAVLIMGALQGWWANESRRLSGVVRGVAGAWLAALQPRERADVLRECGALASLGDGRSRSEFRTRVSPMLVALAESAGLAASFDGPLACEWLIHHAAHGSVDEAAAERAEAVHGWASGVGVDLRTASFPELVRWISDLHPDDLMDVTVEAAWKVLDESVDVVPTDSHVEVRGLRSSHRLIRDGAITLDPGDAWVSYSRYRRDGVARFATFAERRRSLLSDQRRELDLDRLRPKVINSFVRNRLIDEVYLPLFGDNIARQIGLNGAAQGLLLLISPPGYGKTTLLEYVADLLGFAMVKINGPALGTGVTSLDPGAAPDTAAAEELVKLNRAFAMGNNVLCVIDDIQHTSSEFLQKFISLCDATRRVDGVSNGEATTFSLASKRFIMAMAGNPYTSAGASFRIPDMLANRADVYNLGDMAASAADAFAQSYVENACGVNEVLAPVLSRGRHDLELLLRAATGATIRSDELNHTYPAAELTRITATLGHLLRVRDVLLKVNAAYIRSAVVDDTMRGEPPFLLQGSYRNMARIAQRVLPAMTAEEVDVLLDDHYRTESQTLAASAGWNMLKLGEILGSARDADLAELDVLRQRWREANVSGDPLAVMATALTGIADALRPPTP